MSADSKAVAVLFDIDGTLITTGGASASAWRRAFEELHGIAANVGDFSDSGMTDPEVGRRTLAAVLGREPEPRELARVLAKRLEYLPEAVHASDGYRVMPGVHELLRRLADAGYLLGLTTGGTDGAAHIKLCRGDLVRWFPFGGYGSDSPDRTELTRIAIERGSALVGEPLDPKRVLVVGDTPLDVNAAHGVGAVSVGVATGLFSEEQLEEAGADHVLGTLEEELPL